MHRSRNAAPAVTGEAPAEITPGYEPVAGAVKRPGGFQRFFVLFTITFTSIAVLLMVAGMYYRWYTTREPTSAIVIEGDETVAGAAITVVSDGSNTISAKLTPENKFTTPILLPPGSYTLVVDLNGDRLLKKDFVLEEREGRKWYLGKKAIEYRTQMPD